MTAFLPTLAEMLAGWFPELDGRAVAVTDSTVTKDNVPVMPYVQVALIREDGNHKFGGVLPKPHTVFVIEFWFKPEKYVGESGRETPFWAYYDYEPLRDALLSKMINLGGETWGQFRYDGVEMEALTFATLVTFRFTREFQWCGPENDEDDGHPVRIEYALKAAPPQFWPDTISIAVPVEEEGPKCP